MKVASQHSEEQSEQLRAMILLLETANFLPICDAIDPKPKVKCVIV